MDKACAIPSPEQRRALDIQAQVERDLFRKVDAALQDATEQARAAMEAAGLALPPPAREYLTSIVHQRLFCTLCGADPVTRKGGNPAIALAIIRNSQNIARHNWGATIAASSS